MSCATILNSKVVLLNLLLVLLTHEALTQSVPTRDPPKRNYPSVNLRLQTAKPKNATPNPHNGQYTTSSLFGVKSVQSPNKINVRLSNIATNPARVSSDNNRNLGRSFDQENDHGESPTSQIDDTNAAMTTQSVSVTTNYPMPQKQHFKPGKLLSLLDNEFDPSWLSIDRPEMLIERPSVASMASDPDLNEKLVSLNFSIFTLYDTAGQPFLPQPGLVSLFKTWLHRYATCQMEYVWEQMEPLFWPRYVKRGTCVNEQACSWPPGMKCKPSRSKSLKILRWMCQAEKNESETETTEGKSRNVNRRSFSTSASHNADMSGVGYSTNGPQKYERDVGIRVKPGAKTQNPIESQKKIQKKRKADNEDMKARQKNKRSKSRNNNNNNYRAVRIQKEKREAWHNDPDTSFADDGIFCQWKPILYSVNEKCSCGCSF